jgi:hypothetical protein
MDGIRIASQLEIPSRENWKKTTLINKYIIDPGY